MAYLSVKEKNDKTQPEINAVTFNKTSRYVCHYFVSKAETDRIFVSLTVLVDAFPKIKH